MAFNISYSRIVGGTVIIIVIIPLLLSHLRSVPSSRSGKCQGLH